MNPAIVNFMAICTAFAALLLPAAPRAQSPIPTCRTCHGPSGEGNPAIGAPRIADLPPAYAERQLENFASGKRFNTLMTPIAKSLSAQDRTAVADFYAPPHKPSSAPGRPSSPPGQSSSPSLGEQLALRGRWNDELPGCVQCHGSAGIGVGDEFPPLTGQSALYLENQLRAWKSGTRDPGPQDLMAGIADKLSAADIEAVAAYFSQEPAPAGSPASSQPLVTGPATRESTFSSFMPPAESDIPKTEFGKMVRAGENIFDNPKQYAPAFVGNALRCSSCHLDAGRKADSAPLWAAYVAYPEYRAKNKKVNTFEERLQGCFQFSMNGKAPPLGDPVLVALESYSYWLASGATVEPNLPGRGYPKLSKPAMAADYDRGEAVFGKQCALCHGADGAGRLANDGSMAFPALWGNGSFNWGAGMAGIANAAAFIEANMPFSRARTLTPQQAWDVATFMDSHERPQDPRFTVSVAATRAKFHDSPDSMYGVKVGGRVLGSGSAKPGGTLRHGPANRGNAAT